MLRGFMIAFALTSVFAVIQPASADTDYDKLNGIHTIGVISLLGNELNDPDQKSVSVTERETRRAMGEFFDQRIRDYVIKAIGNRFVVKDLGGSIFSDLRGSQWRSEWAKVGDRLHDTPLKPDVDAVVVVYVDEVSAILSPPGLGAFNEKHMLFGKDVTDVEATYGVGVYNAKTGDRIDYGTGRWPAHGNLTGYAPPIEICDGFMSSESGDQPGSDRISQELWSLLTRSLPYALLNSGLISKQDSDALVTSASPADPSCHVP
ncbi:MAG TPA: hypothetical protein VGH02_15325 [Rhizomicrobium sp.]|jgi:hypothetical protein